eukprot:GFYU01001431.1.p1 GENE.GFYU01001431.1~~GFYU01001431.1.p1  ORF type:complete len:278 (+),score=102.55 GFYU01001431.1:200-1033(+)
MADTMTATPAGSFLSQFYPVENFKFVAGVTPLSTDTCVYGSIVGYLAFIAFLKWFMKDRKPLKLTVPSVIHNGFLVALSAVMSSGMAMYVYKRSQQNGIMDVICEKEAGPLDGEMGFWLYIFYASKYYELLDTVLLALKKKPIIFLHVYHHCCMVFACYSWMAWGYSGPTWWACVVNSFVHVVMYTYYLITSLGRDVWFKKYITSLQLCQFFSGTALISYWFWIRDAQGCKGDFWAGAFAQGVNFTFIILFANFYIQTYIFKKNKKKTVDAPTKKTQ